MSFLYWALVLFKKKMYINGDSYLMLSLYYQSCVCLFVVFLVVCCCCVVFCFVL